jgi:hypothetical protein
VAIAQAQPFVSLSSYGSEVEIEIEIDEGVGGYVEESGSEISSIFCPQGFLPD